MTQFAWHVHHDVLVEPLVEPIENRIAYIKSDKPQHEQELRLRLLKPVKGKLPIALVKAGSAYLKAWEAYDKAWSWGVREKTRDAYIKTRDAYINAMDAYMPEILALHAVECPDCPWDGKTIFPEKKVK